MHFSRSALPQMSTGTTSAFSIAVAPQRKVPRYKLTVPLDLTVLRSGIPDNIPGRTVEIGEGGLGLTAASQLLVGELVRVEFLLPQMNTPVRATAVVRYQHKRCFGLQFLRLSSEQQSTIRYWTRREGEVLLVGHQPQSPPNRTIVAEALAEPKLPPSLATPNPAVNRFPARRILAFAIPIAVLVAVLGWWRWQQEWARLEGSVLAKQEVIKPELQVPAEEMHQRIRYQVIPDYPEDAQRAGVQGTVLLDAIVAADGSVAQVTFLNGPQPLASAAINAVRWWRYRPCVVDGRPIAVETTVSVDFRLSN